MFAVVFFVYILTPIKEFSLYSSLFHYEWMFDFSASIKSSYMEEKIVFSTNEVWSLANTVYEY